MSETDPKIIRAFREEFGFTQASLGEMLGAKPAAVSHWETGRRPLPAHIVARLDQLRRRLLESSGYAPSQALVIGELRMSDGQIALFAWDTKPVSVFSPIAEPEAEQRAVILRDEGSNVEINGWIGFFSIRHKLKKNVLAIIKLTDGRVFGGFLRERPGGVLDVESFFGATCAENIAVEVCCPVSWLKAPDQDETDAAP